MTRPRSRILRLAGFWMLAGMLFVTDTQGATIIAAPEDAGLRAAIEAAQEGDTVVVTNYVTLQSPIRVTKRLTFQSRPPAVFSIIEIRGTFAGELFQIEADGVTFEGLSLLGSPQTDGLRIEREVILRDCYLQLFRQPVIVSDFWAFPQAKVRLERVSVIFNQQGLGFLNLEARDSTFSFNGEFGAAGGTADLDGCTFEKNYGNGLMIAFGTVKNCVFRHNTDFGFYCDPDPGMLSLSSSLFYANSGGGLYLGEQVVATVDNCTFTRHTGPPAIVLSQADDALFRHCTVADNVFIDTVPPGSWPPNPDAGAFSIRAAGRVELQNCLVADNPTNGSLHAAGLVGSWTNGGGNVIGGPALLSPLRDNGGPTLSLLPLPGSPAIDAGRLSDLVRDARGLSRLAGASPDAGAIESGASPLADGDADGLPDFWELMHGLDPAITADASSDADGDGSRALDEFRAHTDPRDPQSVLRIKEFKFEPSPYFSNGLGVELKWIYKPGVTVQVEISTDLRHWRKAEGSTYLYEFRPDGHILYFQGPAEPALSFYRVTVDDSTSD